jgi:hypothetical protein
LSLLARQGETDDSRWEWEEIERRDCQARGLPLDGIHEWHVVNGALIVL